MLFQWRPALCRQLRPFRSAYEGHYQPLVRYFLTENWPIVKEMLDAVYLSSFVREYVHKTQQGGLDWEASHARLVS